MSITEAILHEIAIDAVDAMRDIWDIFSDPEMLDENEDDLDAMMAKILTVAITAVEGALQDLCHHLGVVIIPLE